MFGEKDETKLVFNEAYKKYISMSSEKMFQMGIFTSPSILLSWRNCGACSCVAKYIASRTFSNQVCPGARPATATSAVQPPCQHTRHLSDHFRASTLPKGAGRRECHISLNNSRNLNKLVVFNEKICF